MVDETTHLNSNNNNISTRNPNKGWILYLYTIFSCFTLIWLVLILLFQLFFSVLSLKLFDGKNNSFLSFN